MTYFSGHMHFKFKTKNSNISVFFQIFLVNKLWWFLSMSEFPLLWKTSVKLPFVTKNSKHLVGTSGDDSSVLIEFTPLWKTSVKLPRVAKRRNLIGCYSRSNLIGLTYIHLSFTDSLTHWPVHNIPDALTKRYFFTKNNSTNSYLVRSVPYPLVLPRQ